MSVTLTVPVTLTGAVPVTGYREFIGAKPEGDTVAGQIFSMPRAGAGAGHSGNKLEKD